MDPADRSAGETRHVEARAAEHSGPRELSLAVSSDAPRLALPGRRRSVRRVIRFGEKG